MRTQHDPDLLEAIRDATIAGDVKCLHALAKQLPAAFESLRDADLVDLAVAHGQAGTTLYLTLTHRFEVSPNFDRYHKQFGGDLFAEGVNEYHQTLEVMADAAMNLAHAKGRSIACYGVREFALDCRSTSRTPQPMHPEFLRAAARGDIAAFVEKAMGDERFERCQYRHTGSMLHALQEALPAMQTYAQQLLHDAGPRGSSEGMRR